MYNDELTAALWALNSAPYAHSIVSYTPSISCNFAGHTQTTSVDVQPRSRCTSSSAIEDETLTANQAQDWNGIAPQEKRQRDLDLRAGEGRGNHSTPALRRHFFLGFGKLVIVSWPEVRRRHPKDAFQDQYDLLA